MANICDTLTESDLASVINLSEFKECIHWEDVGLELIVATSDINKIKADHYEITDRKREMICVWLRNGENPTLEELKQVIKRVNERHEREKKRYSTAKDEKEAINSVHQLETLLDVWEVTNKKILADKSRLVTELQKEEEFWFQNVKRWNDEKSEWEEGYTGKQRRDIMNALQQGVNVENEFVKALLRSKGYNSSTVKNEAAECILRQALMEIDIDRSKIVGIRYQEMKKHYKQLDYLSTEIMETKDLLDERLRAYEKIREGLLNIGTKTATLEKLNAQLQSLQETTHKFSSTVEKCATIFQQENDNFNDFNKELNVFLESFNANIQQMTKMEKGLFEALLMLVDAGVTIGYITMLGAGIGNIVVPVVGAGIGAALGFGVGSLIYSSRKARVKVEGDVQSYRYTLKKGKIRMNKLRHMYAD